MATITVMDPVTRIEGHMKVEVEVDTVGGVRQIVDAKCTGTLFRGFEKLLEGRNPLDAVVITQRICGVCPISHGMAAALALDEAGGISVPSNARILRNLTLGANFVQSHILHFYLLAALDYIPAPNVSPWSSAWQVDIRSDSRLANVGSNLTKAFEARRRAHELGAVFGGKMPLSHTFIPGGFTAVPSREKIAQARSHLRWLTEFIQTAYIPDVKTVGEVYMDYFSVGAGSRNLLAYGVFPEDNGGMSKLLQGGVAENASRNVDPVVDLWSITEAVTHSWYKEATNGLNPSAGDTQAVFPKTGAYSWLKAPRYMNQPFEVGPLARMWVSGLYQNGVSVMDRHVARAEEALHIALAMDRWLDELQEGDPVFDLPDLPLKNGEGVGLTEAPRGALGHWVKLENGVIRHYQIITPTCWNASPRDDFEVPGPMEQALIGTPVQDGEHPIEALRVVHSFDPCLSCAVHVIRPSKKPVVLAAGLR